MVLCQASSKIERSMSAPRAGTNLSIRPQERPLQRQPAPVGRARGPPKNRTSPPQKIIRAPQVRPRKKSYEPPPTYAILALRCLATKRFLLWGAQRRKIEGAKNHTRGPRMIFFRVVPGGLARLFGAARAWAQEPLGGHGAQEGLWGKKAQKHWAL